MHQPVHLHPVRPASLLSRIRLVLAVSIAVLILGSFAAFAAPYTISVVLSMLSRLEIATPTTSNSLLWLEHIQLQLGRNSRLHPMLHYGVDLVAFVELVFALALIGPLRTPIRNQWIIQVGILACGGLVPVALILGPWQGLPMAWQLVSCVASLCGAAPLMLCRHYIALYECVIDAVRRRHRQSAAATLPFPAAKPQPDKRSAKPSASA